MLPELLPIVFSFFGNQKRSLLEAMLVSKTFFALGVSILYRDVSLRGPWERVSKLAVKICGDTLDLDKFRHVRRLYLGGEGLSGRIRPERAGRAISVDEIVESLAELLPRFVSLEMLAFAPPTDYPPISDVIWEKVKNLPVSDVHLLVRHRGLTFGRPGTTLPRIRRLTLHRSEWRLSFETLMAGTVDGLALVRWLPNLESWSLVSDASHWESPAWQPETWFLRLFPGRSPGNFFTFRSEFAETGTIMVTISMTSDMLAGESAGKVFPEILKTIRAMSPPAVLDTLELVRLPTELVLALGKLGKLRRLRLVAPKMNLDEQGRTDSAAVLGRMGTKIEVEWNGGDEPEEALFWNQLADSAIVLPHVGSLTI